jgi:hypothetical protein
VEWSFLRETIWYCFTIAEIWPDKTKRDGRGLIGEWKKCVKWIVFTIISSLYLQIKNFRDYVELYTKDKVDDNDMPLKICYEQPHERWEIAVTLSEKGFQQISFVNSIATTKVYMIRDKT